MSQASAYYKAAKLMKFDYWKICEYFDCLVWLKWRRMQFYVFNGMKSA